MYKIFLLLSVLIFAVQSAFAGITINGNNGYNRGYYYPPVRYGRNYNNSNYYNNRYNRYYRPNRYYYNPYNQQPVIYRSRVRRSLENSNVKNVSNQFSGIEKIERQLLRNTYEYDTFKNRIERLEHKIFGAAQNGSLEERFVVLQSAAKNYKAFNPDSGYSANYGQNSYQGYRPPIFTGTMGSSWKNTLLGNFRNQFTGTPTGFTPAMDPAYMDWFEAERAMMGNGRDVDYRTNHGYYRSNSNQGARTGVTILD